VHDVTYIEALAGLSGTPTMLDADTFMSAHTHEIALLAAGAACLAVESALDGSAPACAVVRPPGHHAEAGRAMGFCFFNNVAVAAAHARANGCERVAIVDFDVHHGNGTQWMFYDDPAVLYVSIHQSPYYPGTGAADEVGSGPGYGFTVNVPLEAGAGDADYDQVFREAVVPIVSAFAPDLLLVSAGFDLHSRDPLGGMRVTTPGVAGVVRHLRHLAATGPAADRVVVVTEGGYDLEALGASLDATIGMLDAPVTAPDRVAGDSSRAARALVGVRRALGGRWATL
jgi:acetoin utilization deacetylase AcuC-like enzyme